MEFDNSAYRTSTFSKLLPVSRRVDLNLTLQCNTREMPAAYRLQSKDDQASGDLEQLRNTDLDDEMRAVQLSYTARIGDQDLSPNAREMYQLVIRMAGDALLESNEHPEASIQKVDAVRTMDRYIRETIFETNSVRRDLMDLNNDNRLYRFHAHLGDYAGAICNELKNSGKTPHLSRAWILLVKDLDEFDSKVARWIDRGRHGKAPTSEVMLAIRKRVQELIDGGFDLDIDTALHAIRSYARRNLVSHGGAREHKVSPGEDASQLALVLDEVDNTLESVLPDQEKAEVGKWRKILTFYRDLHISKDEEGRSLGRDLQKNLAGESEEFDEETPPRSGLEHRELFDIGYFRPTGLGGPPPNNVSWDPSSFRRHSDAEHRGIKRPAEKQLDDSSRVKRVRVAIEKDAEFEDAMHSYDEESAMKMHDLQRELFEKASLLGQVQPSVLRELIVDMIKYLEGKIGKMRTDIRIKEERAKRKAEKRIRRAGKGPDQRK